MYLAFPIVLFIFASRCLFEIVGHDVGTAREAGRAGKMSRVPPCAGLSSGLFG